MKYGEFLNYFFCVTKFNRNDIFSSRKSEDSVQQRRCLIYCLHLFGLSNKDICEALNKTRWCIKDSLENVKVDEKMLAEQIVLSWRRYVL